MRQVQFEHLCVTLSYLRDLQCYNLMLQLDHFFKISQIAFYWLPISIMLYDIISFDFSFYKLF